MTVAALIVAAGKGTRLGAPLPKQYLPLGDTPVLRHTVKAFLAHSSVDCVQVVISSADRALYEASVGDLGLPEPADGGTTRQESVFNGLLALEQSGIDKVLIHDAARPFVSEGLIQQIVDGIGETGAIVPVLPVTDSVKLAWGDLLGDDVDRSELRRTQTPQGFRFDLILEAHRAAVGLNLTDDAAVAAQASHAVRSAAGEERNFKITTSEDMDRARRTLAALPGSAQVEYRSGSGFDVHRFADGRPMIICGIKIPFDRGLEGHSDADVGLHAITDAILGAIADGDIGDHFPPTDPQWRGAPSDVFLAFAGSRVIERGGHIASIDVTIICERPKIKPHRQAMRERIAAILAMDTGRVSVKATTTERLGYTGRQEGIAAQAVATVALPVGD